MAKVKIVPALLDSTAFSELEKQTFKNMSSMCSLGILSKIWQMLIKGVGELNLAPSPIEALEMILLRIAYSASLPTPMEILNEVKKNSDNTIIPQQPSPVEIEKKNNITAPQETNNFQALNTVEDLLSYLEKSKKALMEFSIKNDISIQEFSNGYIKMTISQNLHQDFIINFRKLLAEVTGKNWEIEILKGDLGETIADKEKTAVEAKKKNVAEYPLVKKILEEFKGSKIETVIRKNISEIAEEEPEMTITTYADEEE